MTKCSRFLWFLTTELRESSGRYLVKSAWRWPNTNASNSVGLRKKRNNENWFKVRQPATRMSLNFHKVFCFSLLISTWKVSNLNQRELSFLREILGFNSTGEKTESMINYMGILKTLIQRLKTLSLPLPLSRCRKASHLVKFWLGVRKYLTSWRSNHALTT